MRRFLGRVRLDPRRRYHPEEYWEARATELISGYDSPESWKARSWMSAGVEEVVVPELLLRCRADSAFVIGSGSGRQYEYLEPAGISLRGIDISPTLVAECRKRYPHISTRLGSVVGADRHHTPADAVLSTAVLQHVTPRDVVAAMASVRALARKTIVLRELTSLASKADYLWAHDYGGLLPDWHVLHDEVTDSTDRFEVRLLAFTREAIG